jgi:hypothetical protein
MAEIFAIIVAVMMIAGAPPYLLDILKGKTKPQRASWFIWSLLGIIAFFSQLKLHGAWSLVFVGLDAIGNLLVFGLSFKYGSGGWGITDRIALVIALISLTISILLHQPVLALSGVILADMSGAVLTMVKTYKHPASETTITWLFLGTASLIGALSVGKLDWKLLLYPVYLSVANYGIVVAQIYSPKMGLSKLRFK